ncbi:MULTISPECIES: 3-dehydroquinate synthase [Bacteroides]|jgi:3-dehydroquinate synthase|uniref:3-dehydroquinate synthase n=1 Tax=Bacteroides TaxID=816 RepID=UPI000E4D2415|nr:MULTISPECIES: 3-dehydroquinate synthase [Bacteroides]MBU8973724.1 3-dehydroquinate synthase [Bacteroides eggerthii]MBU8998543.1 3-dehydroquinate synthase [Bacteroides eggerthii]MCG4760015.1 3-dehydroquinate synthase [Bacteroides eggerthii]RHI73156.1 3-dehydroquinate synthase [Bacteroides eggerthii]
MSKLEVILCESLENSLAEAIEKYPHDRLFILTDEHTHRLCLPQLQNIPAIQDATEIIIGAEDVHKNLETLASVWQALSEQGATRHSLLINLGGGMVTDLGGFAAATFKRGIAYINIPTTLLSMVDASVGGKTGINFNGLKNEIGVFAPASSVLLETEFLRSLDAHNFFSGYAEMLKHGLISTPEHFAELLSFDTEQIDYAALKAMVGRSVQVKENIVEQDPKEHGIRKALNLGHTIGHAFESLALAENRPVLHGYAVAWGIVCELYLSHIKTGFPKEKMRQTIQFIKENYGAFAFNCKQYDRLYELMLHDKKNTAGIINFTLLKEVGDICLNQTADKETIFEVLDFYRECMGI